MLDLVSKLKRINKYYTSASRRVRVRRLDASHVRVRERQYIPVFPRPIDINKLFIYLPISRTNRFTSTTIILFITNMYSMCMICNDYDYDYDCGI